MSDRITILVSTFADLSAGEAIKALQFFERLADRDARVHLVTHIRSRRDLEDHRHLDRIHFAADGWVQHWFWRAGIMMPNVLLFHWRARALIRRIAPPGAGHVVHYVCPISPVMPRFPPRGYRLILGPLNGNIAYPPAFAAREGLGVRLRRGLHFAAQRLLRLTGEKRRYDRVLVSGYARTRASLAAAGVASGRMTDVMDAGLPETWRDRPRLRHQGRNGRFVTAGRLIDLKAIDLAIRAVAQASPEIRLDIFGEGPMRPTWEQLAQDLGVADRVRFCGWCAHDELLARFSDYRGFVFPTLAEANGIVMQEAMLTGLPVIALDWGGPSGLADADSAVYIEPHGPEHVTGAIAKAMDRLAGAPDEADAIAARARTIAEDRFPWDRVIETWTAWHDPRPGSSGGSGAG